MPIRKYLHCGACWEVLGEIPSSESTYSFDTFDCSWSCDCGRLNLSSDGTSEVYDTNGNLHEIYVRDNKEGLLVKKIPTGFIFDRITFRPELVGKLIKNND